MRPAIYNVYKMKEERLPRGAREAWLRTYPDESPADDYWTFIGVERKPSRFTIAEMEEQGFSYREIPIWLDSSRRWYRKKDKEE
ncbi:MULTISPECIES: hypothetical protein [Bradyrhizobium]|jgi:hypothetical protein|uniref:hypothetical protein n=1 Tax=Bradyrhizobium TaxID=374 RepID=UPI001EDB64A8|nr:hypothetical protein [Bradyrhizobium zhengyangense]MCG2645651.1 hypothetical protein [Bradyrhizobium zhengyangense]